jgi:hypothetical protein
LQAVAVVEVPISQHVMDLMLLLFFQMEVLVEDMALI